MMRVLLPPLFKTLLNRYRTVCSKNSASNAELLRGVRRPTDRQRGGRETRKVVADLGDLEGETPSVTRRGSFGPTTVKTIVTDN